MARKEEGERRDKEWKERGGRAEPQKLVGHIPLSTQRASEVSDQEEAASMAFRSPILGSRHCLKKLLPHPAMGAKCFRGQHSSGIIYPVGGFRKLHWCPSQSLHLEGK